uniref:protein-serine/threonine phosphatase n=1 Tax=Aegilops tauschii subsp. strangulata TaxID=200361 RepID=A0A453AJR4_AEGTS
TASTEPRTLSAIQAAARRGAVAPQTNLAERVSKASEESKGRIGYMACAVAPGSPVFSPSRLGLLEQLQLHHHHGCSSGGASFLPSSPLRPFALRARIHPEPSPCACCVTALLREGGRQLVVSGAGDCRAVLSRGGRAEALTDDHRASRQDERDRIEALKGGLVLNCRGVWRVQGSLAVTRGIGDAHLKPWVVAEPETRTVDVGADCELLILASDGLWDKVGNQEAVDAAASSSGDLPAACRRLVDMAVSRGSSDDISVLVVQLQRPLR